MKQGAISMKQVISKWWARILISGVITAGSCFLIAATLDGSEDPYVDKTVSSFEDIYNQYLIYRANGFHLIPPAPDSISKLFRT